METNNKIEIEQQILDLLWKLKPYGKIEIALNQDGSQYSIYLTNPEKKIIIIKETED